MKDKICMICKLGINIDKEFAEFKHHKNKNEVLSRAYYHIDCFREKVLGYNNQNKVAQKAMELFNKIGERI